MRGCCYYELSTQRASWGAGGRWQARFHSQEVVRAVGPAIAEVTGLPGASLSLTLRNSRHGVSLRFDRPLMGF